jgi:hypothetical protein
MERADPHASLILTEARSFARSSPRGVLVLTRDAFVPASRARLHAGRALCLTLRSSTRGALTLTRRWSPTGRSSSRRRTGPDAPVPRLLRCTAGRKRANDEAASRQLTFPLTARGSGRGVSSALNAAARTRSTPRRAPRARARPASLPGTALPRPSSADGRGVPPSARSQCCT